MEVIPVIDLLNGQVVRGVGGRRDEYRPIVSSLALSAEPGVIAAALRAQFALPRLYVADLDAITRGKRDLPSWRAIAATGVSLLIDAGVRSAQEAAELADLLAREFCHAQFVIGLESLSRLDELARLSTSHPAVVAQAVFSLDLKAGVPITPDDNWKSKDPLQIAQEVERAGLRQLIVLDLADVGGGRGTSTLALVREIKEQIPNLQIIAGGGVRSALDLQQLKDAGASAALVASALHDGRLTPADLRSHTTRA